MMLYRLAASLCVAVALFGGGYAWGVSTERQRAHDAEIKRQIETRETVKDLADESSNLGDDDLADSISVH
jgi:hypothetical protein